MRTTEAPHKHKIEHWHKIAALLILYDIIAIGISYILALLLRFDFTFGSIPKDYLYAYEVTILPYAVICVLLFMFFHMYKAVWRYFSYHETLMLLIVTAITLAVNIVGTFIAGWKMPISYYLFGICFQFMLTFAVRLSYRFFLLIWGKGNRANDRVKHVMIVGAGNSGQALLRDIKTTRETAEKVYCFIDDNPNKWSRYIEGIPVVGGRDDILYACSKYSIEKIYTAFPSATAEQKRDVLNICKESGCELLDLPGMYQFRMGEITVSAMKEVQIEDLLGREPIKVNSEEIFDYIREKVVLVTGGGGSIGSELCRQLAAHKPKQLIIVDIYENNAYDISNELKKNYPELDLVTLIGSVRDSRRIFQIMDTYRPQIVYHAAAHKHVPLMEDSPCESIKNNAIGTHKTAMAAAACGCERFVLISTDKAVNPTNIMGASKRLCEMIIQAMDHMIRENRAGELPVMYTHSAKTIVLNELSERLKNSKTVFAAVRFGNVLGSNGSVIPLFKKQIAAGGPVTVTHPDIIRYFMTIPEAVSLVLQAGLYANGGEIYVLDMGEPVKIDDLARNLIKLSGLKPDEDIKIVYTGLRPGEKLYEEKLMAEEGLRKTANELIHIGLPIPFDIDTFLKQLNDLMQTAYNNSETIRDDVMKIVTTYKPA